MDEILYYKIKKLYNSRPSEIDSEYVYNVGMELASDLSARGELMKFIQVFGSKLTQTERADLYRKTTEVEGKWVEDHLDEIKERNDNIYKNKIELKEREDLPMSHPYNRRASICKQIEDTKVRSILSSFKQAKDDIEKAGYSTVVDADKAPVNMNMGAVKIITNGKVVCTKSLKKDIIKIRDEAIEKNKGYNNNKNSKKNIEEVRGVDDDDEFYFDD